MEHCSDLAILDLEGCEEATGAGVGQLVIEHPELAINFQSMRFHRGHRFFVTNASLRAAVKEWCENEEEARAKYGDIADWDVSNVTNMK